MKSFLIQLGWSFIDGRKLPLMAPTTFAKTPEDAKLCFMTAYPGEIFCLCGSFYIDTFDDAEDWKRLSSDYSYNFELRNPN